MPELPISFTKGINRLNGAPTDSIYDIANAYIDAYDEVKAWRRGDTEDSTWLPNAKPWVKFSERWFDSRYMDDYLIYRNRLYMTQVVEGDNGIQNRTLQVVDFVDTDGVLENNASNHLSPLDPFSFETPFTGEESGRVITQEGQVFLAGVKRSWGADDPGIIGVTLGRAVDYLFIPIDKFGQAGPWKFATVFADLSTSGATNISGTDVYTVVPTFDFTAFTSVADETTYDYERVLVYRTIEYDLDGITIDPSFAGAAENVALGGFYFEGAMTESGYKSEAYWPFNIQTADSGRSDQLGPALDRTRNLWSNRTDITEHNRQVGAKAAHIDGGVAIYGNVNIPTNVVERIHSQAGAISTGTFTMVNGSPDTITRASGSFVADGIIIGDTIVVNGFSTQANNRSFTVVNVTSTTITLNTTTTVTGEASANAIITNAPEFVYQYRYEKEDGTNAYGDASDPERDARAVIPWYGESGLIVYVRHEATITDIDATNNTISILGDWVSFFTINFEEDQVTVDGTASNDGVFTPTHNIIDGPASYSAGVTTITMAEDITVDEGAVGTMIFYVVWEKLTPDFNGRYISVNNVDAELYTVTTGGIDWETNYISLLTLGTQRTLLAAPYTASLFLREESVAYLSQVNAPWEITVNGFRIPDSSEILAITPSRLEEIEQISSYSFYVFTKNGIYAAARDGYDVLLTAIESVIGLKVFSGYPLVEVVKGGVVFFGTDDNLYFMTGRQVQRLDYVVSDLFGTVVDMAFDPVEEYLYVYSDTGIWIYDFIRQIWIGQYTIGQDVNNYDIQFEFSDSISASTVATDPFGTDIVLTDDIVFDEDNFRIFSERVPNAFGFTLNFYVDRDIAATTDLIATAEKVDAASDWTISAGDILSGDVTVLAGDTLRMEVNDPGFFVDANPAIVKVKGGVGAGNVTLNLGSIGFDPQFKKMLFRYTVSGGLVIEEMDQTGDVMPCEVHTQEIGGVAVQKNDYIKIDYDGVEHTGVGSGTFGTNVVTIASGDVPGHTRDKMGMIVIPQGGIDNYGTQTRLITTISSVGSIGDISLADNLRNAVTSQTIDWRSPALLTLFLLDSGTFRDRELGTYRIVPNKKYYLPGRPRRFQLKIENFDVVREILIFLTNSIEQD